MRVHLRVNNAEAKLYTVAEGGQGEAKLDVHTVNSNSKLFCFKI